MVALGYVWTLVLSSVYWLSDGTTISMDRILALFLKLSDESQVDIVKIMGHTIWVIRLDTTNYRGQTMGEEKTGAKVNRTKLLVLYVRRIFGFTSCAAVCVYISFHKFLFLTT